MRIGTAAANGACLLVHALSPSRGRIPFRRFVEVTHCEMTEP
jgi:hypothetical protein